MFTLKSTLERREGKEARLQAIEKRIEQLSLTESVKEIDNTQFLKVEERVASFEENARKSNEAVNRRIDLFEDKLIDLSGVVSGLQRDAVSAKRVDGLEETNKRIEDLEQMVKDCMKIMAELREQNHALETRLSEVSRRSFALGSNPVTPIGFTFGSGLARTSGKFAQKHTEQKDKDAKEEKADISTEA